MDEIKKDCRSLEEKLSSYNKIKKKSADIYDDISIEDLLYDGKVQEIHPELLRDAAAYSEEKNSEAYLIHELAREILILWARIYCGKAIRKRYKYCINHDIEDKIHDGVIIGVVKCFESIRGAVNQHFSVPENLRIPFLSKGKTVQDYMLICVTNKVRTELGKYYHDRLTEITCEEADRLEKDGENVYRKNGRAYVGKFLPLEIPDEDGLPYGNAEVMEKITLDRSHCADEILHSRDVRRLTQEVIAYMHQNGLLDQREQEFISRCFGFRGGPEKLADIERDWKNCGKNIKGENLYNLRRSILKKIQNVIQENPEWIELSYHAAA